MKNELDPQVAAFYGDRLKNAPAHAATVIQARDDADAAFNDKDSWRIPVFRTEDRQVPAGACRRIQEQQGLRFFSARCASGDGSHEIPVRVYFPFCPDAPEKPADVPGCRGGSAAVRTSCGSSLPLMLYFHGGGFIMHNIASHDSLCRKLALECGCAVVSVGYRLAPEYKYPACMEDGFDVLLWAHHNAAALGCDPGKIILAGDSAGASISAVLSLLIRDLRRTAERLPAGGRQNGLSSGASRQDAVPAAGSISVGDLPVVGLQILCYGPAGCIPDDESPSVRLFGQGGYVLPRTMLDWCMEQYLPKDADPLDPCLNPGRAADLTGLPPTLCITAECDPLRDDGEAFARRLKDAGNAVTLYRAPGMMHGFLLYWHKFDRALDVIRRIAEEVRTVL